MHAGWNQSIKIKSPLLSALIPKCFLILNYKYKLRQDWDKFFHTKTSLSHKTEINAITANTVHGSGTLENSNLLFILFMLDVHKVSAFSHHVCIRFLPKLAVSFLIGQLQWMSY